jgi:glycosyltransferase involved in cell wall biosynthesis
MSGVDAGGSPFPRLMLSTLGDATDVRIQSGLTFYLLAEARRQGFISGALPLTPTTSARYQLHRAVWNARRVVAGEKPGGYLYTAACQELEWDPVRDHTAEMRFLQCYQLMAPSLLEECAPRTCFYIDMTLRQLFGSRYETRPLGEVATAALALEKRGYQAAQAVIARSAWAAASVIADYDVAPNKVHVVLHGANLDRTQYEEWQRAELERRGQRETGTQRDGPVRFVFVGYDWRRKGLDRLLRSHSLARERGSTAIVRVIGCARRSLPRELRDVSGVEWCGVIDKRTHAATYLRLVAECQIGCLLSHDEAAGFSLREYGALGLAILVTTAGGAPEMAPDGTSVRVDPADDDERVADLLMRLSGDREWRESLRAAAWEQRREFSWSLAVERLAAVVDGSPPRRSI